MRTIAPVFALLGAYALSIPAILAQTNPPPPDPNELVKRDPITLTRPADRSAALDLLERARHDLNLHDISSPYSLKVSFATSGDTQNEGEGTMEEFTDGASLWRWTAQLGDSLVVRIGNQDHVYGTNPDEPVPLRVQMLRAALHWPVPRNAGADAIRAAKEHAGPIDLLLTDVVMPEMTGRELAGRLVRRFPKMKVLYMSGYTDDAIGNHGLRGETLRVMQKPFTHEILSRRVREKLESGFRP